LLAKAEGVLPPLCNVIVDFEDGPRRAGQRWEIPLVTPTGARQAVLAVHSNPLPAELRLNYPSTAESLLAMFSDARLRALLVRGERALIQAEPRFSQTQQRLFLNVEAILLAQPWRTFGRRQIDFGAGCARKHYLSLKKGVRARINPRLPPTWQSLAGQVAHDLIEAAALDLPSALARNDDFIKAALSPATAMQLAVAGASNLSIAVTAMARGLRVLEVLARSPALADLLRTGGPWLAETDAFDRGVTLTPDLVGDRVVVELKRQSPESAFARRDQIIAQARGYLAWAMVTYGIDQVTANWRAVIVNLHDRVPEAERITSITVGRDEVAHRILNRHRLLAVSDGSWLPAPTETECTRCEFHRVDPDRPDMPPACQFHCQAERNWPCADLDSGATCPLYGNCEEHRRYRDFRLLDLFNRLREELAEEDEEGEAAAAAVAANGAQQWGPFRVSKADKAGIRLKPPDSLGLIDGAIPGQVFDLRVNGAVIARARFRRLRGGDWQLLAEGGIGRLKAGQDVWLGAVGLAAYPARAQMTYLDRMQRSGGWPGALRYGGLQRKPVKVLHCRLDTVPPEADTVVVDAPTGNQQAEALLALLPTPPVRCLILLGTEWDVGRLPSHAILFDEFTAHAWLTEAAGNPTDRVKIGAQKLAQATHIALPWDLLTSGILDGWGLTFDVVVVTDAHALPGLALSRALELCHRRLVLIGSSLAAGPATEAVRSARSPLFANLIQQTIDTGGALLPEHVQTLGLVRLTSRIASGLSTIVRASAGTIPINVHRIAGRTGANAEQLTMRASTPLATGQNQAVEVQAKLPAGSNISYRAVRSLLRNLAPSAFDRLLQNGLPNPGHVDGTLLGKRVVIVAARSSLVSQQNQLTLTVPQGMAPLSLREGLTNVEEAAALVAHASAHPDQRFVATSPFAAQCRTVAAEASAAKIENLRVHLPERVPWKAQAERSVLLVSLAVTDSEGVAHWPYNHPGNMLPLLVGNWQRIEVFCSPAMAEHPIVSALSEAAMTNHAG
jgi:hypothetical protein